MILHPGLWIPIPYFCLPKTNFWNNQQENINRKGEMMSHMGSWRTKQWKWKESWAIFKNLKVSHVHTHSICHSCLVNGREEGKTTEQPFTERKWPKENITRGTIKRKLKLLTTQDTGGATSMLWGKCKSMDSDEKNFTLIFDLNSVAASDFGQLYSRPCIDNLS